MNRFFVFLLALGLVACNGNKTSETTAVEDHSSHDGHDHDLESQDPGSLAQPRLDVPIVGDYFSKEQMEGFLGLQEGAIYDVVKNVDESDKNDNSIFFKISDPELGNAAVMLQASKNPLPDDISDYDYASYYINIKVTDGERTMQDPMNAVPFEEWDQGLSGAYNKDLGKYYWRDKDNVIYCFALNTTLPINQQFDAAMKVAESITPKE